MAIRTITMICFGLLIETMAAQTAPGIHIPDKPENLAQLREINLDIWKPFSEAYATNDAEKYIGLHALDFIRANGGTWAATKNLNEYAVGVRKNFARNIAQNRKVTIDFTFFERAAGAETASERGIYRVSSTEKDSLPQFFYGQFHVFHRKIGGKWKIAVDYDSDENGTITAEQFNAGWPTEVLLASDAEKRLSKNGYWGAEKEIRAAAAAFSEFLKKANWEAVAEAYTPDARIFPPGQNVVEGREAIRAVWAASPKTLFHKITPLEIKITGSEAWDWGVYEGKSVGTDGKESSWKGKYVIVWKKVSPGGWKMYLDIWNRMPD